jgi:Na+/H+ antiporter NhaD/arsenite permease-like protein
MTFTAMASGLVGGGAENLTLLLQSEYGQKLLAAVSCGSVFMGALTYIGNAPNFMVKSIAERHDVETPSFGGYIVYSILILTPLFLLLTLIFFHG